MGRRATESCLQLPPTRNEAEGVPDMERTEMRRMDSYQLADEVTRKLTGLIVAYPPSFWFNFGCSLPVIAVASNFEV